MKNVSHGLEKVIRSSTFSTYCQEISRLRLSAMINGENTTFAIAGVKPDEHPGHWMAVIFAASDSFRLTLKITYSLADASLLTKLNRGEFEGGIEPHLVHDFMREYSNQLVGALKCSIENQAGYAKTSLPLVTHAVDAQFFGPNPSSSYFEDEWLLSTGDVRIHHSITFEFFDRAFKSKIYLPAFYDPEALTEIEFFS